MSPLVVVAGSKTPIQSLGFPEEALNQNEFSFSTDQNAASCVPGKDGTLA